MQSPTADSENSSSNRPSGPFCQYNMPSSPLYPIYSPPYNACLIPLFSTLTSNFLWQNINIKPLWMIRWDFVVKAGTLSWTGRQNSWDPGQPCRHTEESVPSGNVLDLPQKCRAVILNRYNFVCLVGFLQQREARTTKSGGDNLLGGGMMTFQKRWKMSKLLPDY